MVLKVIIFAPPLKSFLMDLFTEWVYVELFLESDNESLETQWTFEIILSLNMIGWIGQMRGTVGISGSDRCPYLETLPL